MSQVIYNNQGGSLASDPGTGTTIQFAVAPDFATLTTGQWITLNLDAGLGTYEVVYLTAYTSGATSGTIQRAAEDGTDWPAVGHPVTVGPPPTGTWVCSPTRDDLNDLGGIAGAGTGFGNYTGVVPIPDYTYINTGPTLAGHESVAIAVDDLRFVPTTVTSSGACADNSATHKVFVNPTFAGGVTDYGMTGYAVAGFVGAGGSSVNLSANGRFAGFACHLDVTVPVFGLYGFQAHLGLFANAGAGNIATEMVAFDINELNSFGATATKVVGFRLPSGTGMVGLTNWGLMIGNPSQGSTNQITGPTVLGGPADYTVAAAQVDVQNTVALASFATPGTPVLSLTDTPASGSPIVKQTFRSRVTTTNASASSVWLYPVIATGRYLVKATILARQTGGSGGTVGQGAAWTYTVGVKDQTVESVSTPTITGTLPSGWAAPGAVMFATDLSLSVQGAANENVTWWLEAEAIGPLVT